MQETFADISVGLRFLEFTLKLENALCCDLPPNPLLTDLQILSYALGDIECQFPWKVCTSRLDQNLKTSFDWISMLKGSNYEDGISSCIPSIAVMAEQHSDLKMSSSKIQKKKTSVLCLYQQVATYQDLKKCNSKN